MFGACECDTRRLLSLIWRSAQRPLPFRPVSINHCRIGFSQRYVRPSSIYQKHPKLIRLSAKGLSKRIKGERSLWRVREEEVTGHFNFTPRHTTIHAVRSEIAVNVYFTHRFRQKSDKGMVYSTKFPICYF